MAVARPNLILDTDLGGDVDDLGALAVLHAMADAGRCDVLGVVSDTPQRHAVGAIDAVNRWYGRGDVPVGRPAVVEDQDTYANAVAGACGPCVDGNDATHGVALYRELLTDAEDGSVVVATIGVLLMLDELLSAPADLELFRRKVRRVVTMGGQYPRSGERPETNFRCWDNPKVTRRFVDRCPVPIDFVGFELGDLHAGFGTGERINDLPDGHPVRVGYADFFHRPPWWVKDAPSDLIKPWSIWDQITVYAAVATDDGRLARTRGVNHVDDAGHNHFEPTPDGPHSYFSAVGDPAAFARDVIEPLMLTRPTPAD